MPDFLKRNLRSSCHHNFFVQQTGSSLEDFSTSLKTYPFKSVFCKATMIGAIYFPVS